MKIEREAEYSPEQRTHTITVTATSAFAHILTEEALVKGGEMIEQQADQLLMRQVRLDAMSHLGIGQDIDNALRELRAEVEAILRNIEPNGQHLYAFGLDRAFSAAAERIRP